MAAARTRVRAVAGPWTTFSNAAHTPTGHAQRAVQAWSATAIVRTDRAVKQSGMRRENRHIITRPNDAPAEARARQNGTPRPAAGGPFGPSVKDSTAGARSLRPPGLSRLGRCHLDNYNNLDGDRRHGRREHPYRTAREDHRPDVLASSPRPATTPGCDERRFRRRTPFPGSRRCRQWRAWRARWASS